MAMASTVAVMLILILYYVLESWRYARMPAQAPETKLEKIMAIDKTIRFVVSKILKWRLHRLACIIYMMPLENWEVASVYGGSDSVELNGPGMIEEFTNLLKLLDLCIIFSKKRKPSHVLLEGAGYSKKDVLYQTRRARLLKPKFTIMHDEKSKCILLLIRGTHSINDMLTAVRAAAEPFEHSVVKGYAHHGMVAAARWIGKQSTPHLLRALCKYPDCNVKIVGHSLGGGTAALLTYILRQQEKLSSTTCVAFAPAACMTWELAESGKHFITTVINGFDFVPTVSIASIDNLCSEITPSPWFKHVLNQSSMEDITEEKWWEEVMRQLQSRAEDEDVFEAQLDAAENKQASSSSDATTKIHQFYPPGRIMHIVEDERVIKIYATPRKLYSKLRLSKKMVDDHHSGEYKRMIELLIKELENNDACS